MKKLLLHRSDRCSNLLTYTSGPPSGQSAGIAKNPGLLRPRAAPDIRDPAHDDEATPQQARTYRVLIEIAEEVVGNARAGLERTRTIRGKDVFTDMAIEELRG